jgi:tetratricopeptide (TPR) repeat protein
LEIPAFGFLQLRQLRYLAAVGLLSVVPAFCASSGTASNDDWREGASIVPGKSSTGNFLAARHARSRHDYTAAADLLLSALDKAPAELNLLGRAHFALLVDGRLPAATKLARQLSEGSTKVPLAEVTLAVDAMRAGRAEIARQHVSRLPETSVNGILRSLLLAWVGFDRRPITEAVDELKPLAGEKPTAALFSLHAALLHAAAGENEAAERYFQSAVHDDKSLPLRTVQLSAAFYQRIGKQQEAERVYSQYREEFPDSRLLPPLASQAAGDTQALYHVDSMVTGAAEALFGVAAGLSRQNAGETALGLARLGLHLRPDFPELQMLAAQVMESFRQYDDANRLYAAIGRDSSIYWHARISIAANFDRMDAFDEAERLLKEMSAERPGDPAPLIELGDILRRRERFGKAVVAYDQAFERLPSVEARFWGLLYARGIALERAKQWPRAEADFLKALEFRPDQPFVLNYLGYSWVEQGKNLEQALEMIRKAVELRPSDGYIVDSLGWALYRLGRYEQAVEELEKAVELRPGDPVINDHLGDAYWMVGRHREAHFQWQAALSFDPEPEAEVEIRRKLLRGLANPADAKSDG